MVDIKKIRRSLSSMGMFSIELSSDGLLRVYPRDGESRVDRAAVEAVVKNHGVAEEVSIVSSFIDGALLICTIGGEKCGS